MRVAVVADSHWDESSRWDECVRVHAWIAEDVARRGIDLVLHAGDVFERRSTPTERAAVAEWLRRVAQVAPVVIVRGNHDAPGDLALFARLRTQHPVIVEEGAAVHVVAGVAIACVSWPRKGALLAQARESFPDAAETAVDALRAILRGLGHELARHEGPRLLLAHAMVRGSRTSSGQPLVGCDLEVGVEDLGLVGADAYFLGHIHRGQAWEIDREPTGWAPVIYPGSPRRTAYGELETKGYTLLTMGPIGGRRHAAILAQCIETPCARMLLVSAAWSSDEFLWTVDDQYSLSGPLDGAEIRFRYSVHSDARDAARRSATALREEWTARGAVDVKVEEEVIATGRARAPEVARASTLPEKLAALWTAKDTTPDAPRAERLGSMAIELEECAR